MACFMLSHEDAGVRIASFQVASSRSAVSTLTVKIEVSDPGRLGWLLRDLGEVRQAQDAARARVKAKPPRQRALGTPRAGDAHTSWGYSVGEEVVIAANSGDLRQGVILCALANGQNAGQAAAGSYRVTFPGGVVIGIAGGAVSITAPGNITITGTVIVTGDVIAEGISLITHTHGDVMPGTSSTGEPQ